MRRLLIFLLTLIILNPAVLGFKLEPDPKYFGPPPGDNMEIWLATNMQPPKMPTCLLQKLEEDPYQEVEVAIELNPSYGNIIQQSQNQPSLVTLLNLLPGIRPIKVVDTHEITPQYIFARLTAYDAYRLGTLDAVKYVWILPPVEGYQINRRPVEEEDIIEARGISDIHKQGYTGKGVLIAIVDDGAEPNHPDYKDAIEENKNFVPGSVMGSGGHATWIAGTIHRLAPDAKLLNINVFWEGKGEITTIIEAMEYIRGYKEKVKVANLSFGISASGLRREGYPVDGSDPLSVYMNEFTQKTGTLLVAAAGNISETPIGAVIQVGSPCVAPNVLCVGAVGDHVDEEVMFYSCRGPTDDPGRTGVKPELVAWGGMVTEKYLVSGCGKYVNGLGIGSSGSGSVDGSIFDCDGEKDRHSAIAGTSMSTPQVVGIAALIIEAVETQSSMVPIFEYGLDAKSLREILTKTAKDIEAPGVDHVSGYGLVDPKAALKEALGGIPGEGEDCENGMDDDGDGKVDCDDPDCEDHPSCGGFGEDKPAKLTTWISKNGLLLGLILMGFFGFLLMATAYGEIDKPLPPGTPKKTWKIKWYFSFYELVMVLLVGAMVSTMSLFLLSEKLTGYNYWLYTFAFTWVACAAVTFIYGNFLLSRDKEERKRSLLFVVIPPAVWGLIAYYIRNYTDYIFLSDLFIVFLIGVGLALLGANITYRE